MSQDSVRVLLNTNKAIAQIAKNTDYTDTGYGSIPNLSSYTVLA